MKKLYISLIGLFAALMVMPACSQLLEPEPYGLVELDLVWTKYNYTSSLVGSIGNAAEFYPNMVYAAYGDEAQSVNDRTGGTYYNWYTLDFDAGTYPMGSNYGGYYNNIRTINFFLQNEHKISFTNVKDEERETWRTKAHYYRALYYFMLMKRFKYAVIYTTPYDLNETFTSVTRSNVEQIADFVMDELDLCLNSTENESSPYTFRWLYNTGMNRGFAWVLKARTAMYAASPLYYEEGSKYTWEYAYQVNKEAVEQLLAHNHALFDIEPTDNYAYGPYDYYHIYYGTGGLDASRSQNKETILSNGGYKIKMWEQYGLPTTKGVLTCGICPTQELVDCYETIDGEPILDLEHPYLDKAHTQPNYNKNNHLYDPQHPYENRDPRFYGSIYYNGAPRWWSNPDSLRVETYVGGNCGISDEANEKLHTRTGYYVRKFNCAESDMDTGSYDGSIQYARLAEMFLNLAECACEAGHMEDAYNYTNLVRERVGMPDLPTGLTKDQLRLRIRNERRVELAFENFRFDDVRRWKIIDQTEENVTGMRIIKDDATGEFTYTRFSLGTRTNKGADKYLLFPMSEEEVNKMKYLTGEDWQTPGWGYNE